MKKYLSFFLLLFLILFLGCVDPYITKIERTQKVTKTTFQGGIGKITFSLYEGNEVTRIPNVIRIPSPNTSIPLAVYIKIRNEGEIPNEKIGEKVIHGIVCLTSPNWKADGNKCYKYTFYPKLKNEIPQIIVRLPENGFIYTPANLTTSVEVPISICSLYEYYTYGVLSTCIFLNDKALEKYGKFCNLTYSFSKGPLEITEVRQLGVPIKGKTNFLYFTIKLKKAFDDVLIYDYDQGISQINNYDCSILSEKYINRIKGEIIVNNHKFNCTIKVTNWINNEYEALCKIPLSIFSGNQPIYITTIQIKLYYTVLERKKLKDIEIYPPEMISS